MVNSFIPANRQFYFVNDNAALSEELLLNKVLFRGSYHKSLTILINFTPLSDLEMKLFAVTIFKIPVP
jgi:hypothetical protein